MALGAKITGGLKSMVSHYPGAASTLVSLGAWTGVDLAMGNRSFGEWVRNIGIPIGILGMVAPELTNAYFAADFALSMVPMSKELVGAATRGYENTRMTTLTGGPMSVVDTRQAATMRQRAMSDMSASGMTMRNALMGQGRIFHYRYGRYA